MSGVREGGRKGNEDQEDESDFLSFSVWTTHWPRAAVSGEGERILRLRALKWLLTSLITPHGIGVGGQCRLRG